MFSPNVVGTANAIAGGWGNMGGGFTQLLMPLLLDAISHTQPQFVAWRWAYFVPGGCHLLIGFSVLFFAQDLPDGNYAELKKKGEKEKSKGHKEFIAAITNYRTWVLLLTYGYCFGVELTIDNNLAQYFVDNFNLSTQAAGNYAAIFGMLNIVSRPCGGIMSDFIAKRIGIRGRIWWLYSLQLTGGVFCIVLGLMKDSLTNTVVVLIFFSFFLQAACGATYGLVPFISRRALGLVCGLVGAGGSTGSAVTQAIFFTPQSLSPHMGIVYMGVMICGITQSQLTLYWPMWGGALCGPKKGATEEDYYFSEYSEAERKQGLHRSVMKFANESRSMRGMKRIQSETSAADLANPKADVV